MNEDSHRLLSAILSDTTYLEKRLEEQTRLSDELINMIDNVNVMLSNLTDAELQNGLQLPMSQLLESMNSLRTQHKQIKTWVKELQVACTSESGEVEYIIVKNTS